MHTLSLPTGPLTRNVWASKPFSLLGRRVARGTNGGKKVRSKPLLSRICLHGDSMPHLCGIVEFDGATPLELDAETLHREGVRWRQSIVKAYNPGNAREFKEQGAELAHPKGPALHVPLSSVTKRSSAYVYKFIEEHIHNSNEMQPYKRQEAAEVSLVFKNDTTLVLALSFSRPEERDSAR